MLRLEIPALESPAMLRHASSTSRSRTVQPPASRLPPVDIVRIGVSLLSALQVLCDEIPLE